MRRQSGAYRSGGNESETTKKKKKKVENHAKFFFFFLPNTFFLLLGGGGGGGGTGLLGGSRSTLLGEEDLFFFFFLFNFFNFFFLVKERKKKDLVNVGEDTALGNGHMRQKLVELLVVADGELEVTGDDARLLVVTGGVASQLEDLGGEVLENGGNVDGCTYNFFSFSSFKNWWRKETKTYPNQRGRHSCPS